MEIPVMYEHGNLYGSIQNPSVLHADSALSAFFLRYNLQDAISVFRVKVPENWAENYFLYNLFVRGFISVINTDKFGVIPQHCGLYGQNVMYQPTHAIVSNPLLRGGNQLLIGRDCAIFRLQPDYGGVYDIASYYADLMAVTCQTMGVNTTMAKLAYVFICANDGANKSFRKMVDQIITGNPAVFADANLLGDDGKVKWALFNTDVAKNFIAPQLLEHFRQLRREYHESIGIPRPNTDKKERLVTDEVHAGDYAAVSKVYLWLEELQKCSRKCEQLFGKAGKVTFEMRNGGAMNAGDNVNPGAV